MPLSLRPLAAATLALTLAATAQAGGTTVFADSFEDGSVADWSISKTNNITVPQVILRTDSVASGNGALWTFFDAPGGGTGAGTVRASHAPARSDGRRRARQERLGRDVRQACAV